MSSMGNSQDDAQGNSSSLSDNSSSHINNNCNNNHSNNHSNNNSTNHSSENNINNDQSSQSNTGPSEQLSDSDNQSSLNAQAKNNQHIQKHVHITQEITQKLNQPFQDKQAVYEKKVISELPFTPATTNPQKSDSLDGINSTSFDQRDRQISIGTQKLQLDYAGRVHPNFNSTIEPLNPDRPLTDMPAPAPRYKATIEQILNLNTNKSDAFDAPIDRVMAQDMEVGALSKFSLDTQLQRLPMPDDYYRKASQWELIASPQLASNLELLQIVGLIDLPAQFFEPVSADVIDKASTKHNPYKLLAPLTEMVLLDMSDIYQVCAKHPTLTRYGFTQADNPQPKDDALALLATDVVDDIKANPKLSSSEVNTLLPEMINDVFAPTWEVVLYPDRFDSGVDSLTTDILACSVAVHILKQCQTRQSINRRLSAQQICQYMRSYVLSQCNIHPQFEKQYRQIRLFPGHVVVAAYYLGELAQPKSVLSSDDPVVSASDENRDTAETIGFKVSYSDPSNKTVLSQNKDAKTNANKKDQPVYLNISSRNALFIRYPNISSYYVEGWT